MSSEGKLSMFLKTGSDWGKLKTSVPGIFILKMPAYKNSPARLAVELNPVDGSGSPTKKRGIVLSPGRSLRMLVELLDRPCRCTASRLKSRPFLI